MVMLFLQPICLEFSFLALLLKEAPLPFVMCFCLQQVLDQSVIDILRGPLDSAVMHAHLLPT